jgi:NmrA-like family
MIKPRIIVTGATGKTGSVVVTEMLKAGYPIRAMVRREDGRSARLKEQRAEIAVNDMSDGGLPIDLISGIRYHIDDHRRGAFQLDAPTTDVLEVTGRPPEDFETIARRYAALPRNQRTLGNWLRQFAQFMIAPLSPGFNSGPLRPRTAPSISVGAAVRDRLQRVAARARHRRHQPRSTAAILIRRRSCRRNFAFL